MTPKDYLSVISDVVAAVQHDLIDPVSGQFKKQPDLKDDATLIQDVESAYKAHGGVVDANVDKAIAGVVAVLRIIS